MRIPNSPRTGIAALDRFLSDLVAALRKPESESYLPTVPFEAVDSVGVGRSGYLFQCPDHPDGYRLGVTTGTEVRWI